MPRRLVDVSKRDTSIELFGRHQAAPFMIGPTGLNGALWPKGDILLARAAERAGIPFVLATASNASIEEVAAASKGDLWFQLYIVQRQLAEQMVRRAEAAGYSTLVLTTDVAVNGNRERDLRNNFGLPLRYTLLLIDVLTDVGPVPIQTGENWWFPHGMANAIAAGASDLAMVDIMKIGGVTGWMAAMAQAETAALPLSNHTFVEPSAHVMAVAPTASWFEYLDIAGAALTERLLPVDGMVTAGGCMDARRRAKCSSIGERVQQRIRRCSTAMSRISQAGESRSTDRLMHRAM